MCLTVSLSLSLSLVCLSLLRVWGGVWVLYRTNSTTSCPAATQRSIFRQVFYYTFFRFFVIRLFPSSSYFDVIIILLENMFSIYLFFVIIFYSFDLIPYKGEKGRLDYTRTQLLYTIHFVYLVFHANPSFFIVVFLFSFYLFDFIFVSSFDMYTGRLYFRGFIYFKFSLYAIFS